MNDSFSDIVINWFDGHKRDLPWRSSNRSPYEVWISEIMLQQTRVDQMLGYYHAFMKSFPTVVDLANSSLESVLKAWEGLGYYSRAKNMHLAAKQVVKEFDGEFPNNYADLLRLKGVGPYTAAAIASTVFNEKQACVDGNVYRVLSRVFNIDKDISDANALKFFKSFSETLMNVRFGAYNEGLMELGAMICTPKNPQCDSCPVADFCELKNSPLKLERPVKSKKVKVLNLDFDQFLVFNKEGFLVQKGFQGKIWEHLNVLPTNYEGGKDVLNEERIQHKLTHRNLGITFKLVFEPSLKRGVNFVEWQEMAVKPFAKPIKKYLDNFYENELKRY